MLDRSRTALVTAVLVLALVPACATRESTQAVGPTAAPQSSPSSGMPGDPAQGSGATEGDGDEGQGTGEQSEDGMNGGAGAGTEPRKGTGDEAGSDPSDDAGTDPGGTGTSPGGTGGTGTSPGGSPGTTDDGFAWVPFGPADPSDPPPEQMYGSLERRECEALAISSDTPPWPALTAVCRAAVEGDSSQWAVAEAAFATDPGGGSGCLFEEALALLTRALEWHERNPGRTPEISYPTADGETACAFRIIGVQVVDDVGHALGTPLEGPLTGGTLLLIDGEGIDEPENVVIGWGEAEVVEGVTRAEPPDDPMGGGLDDVIVRTPPAPRPGPVEISLRNRAGEVVAPVQFTYVDTETSSGTGGTDTQPTPGTDTGTSDPIGESG